MVAIVTLAAILTAAAIGHGIAPSPSSVSSGRGHPTSPPPPPSASGARTRPAPSPPHRFLGFRDRREMFSIAYPAGWTRRRLADPQIALLVAHGRGASLLVRVTPVGLHVTAKTLPIVRGLTDRLVGAARGVRLLGPPRAIVLGGLPGYRYLYTFNDPGRRQRGAHAHYFLFKNRKLIALVFQVVPARRLSELAPSFDRILRTFRGEAG